MAPPLAGHTEPTTYFTRTNGRSERLYQSNLGVWVYLDKLMEYRFDSTGRITLQIDRPTGEYHQYEYTNATTRYPWKITHSSGRTLTFTYANGRLTRLEDPAGNDIEYEYDANGNLELVRYPATAAGTATKEFFYENPSHPDLMTRMITEAGVEKRWTYDSAGKAIGNETNTGVDKFDVLARTFNATTSQWEVRTRNALGKEAVHYFEVRGGQGKSVGTDGDPLGNCEATSSTITYDANGYYDLLTDREGNVTDYDHDDNGRLQKITEGFGSPNPRTTFYEHEPDSELLLRVENDLQKVLYDYGPNVAGNQGRLETITQIDKSGALANRQISLSYPTLSATVYGSELVKKVVVDGPRSDVTDTTEILYDSQGRLQSVKNALGHETTFSNFDAHGRAQTITYPGGMVTTLAYNDRGWLTSKTDALQARNITTGVPYQQTRTTTYDYFVDGSLDKITYADNTFIDFSYDSSNRLKVVQVKPDEWITLDYDNASNVTRERVRHYETVTTQQSSCCDENGEPIITWVTENVAVTDRETNFQYDALNRLEQITDGNSNSTLIRYNKNDLVKLVENARGYQTTQQYNERNELKTLLNPDGGAVGTSFDDNALLKTVVDAINVTTTYTRNAFGEIEREDNLDSGVWEYDYDSAGNQIEVVDGQQRVTTYTYDALNRVDAIAHPDYAGDTAFAYDTSQPGYLDRVTDYTGYTDFEYNEAGELIKKTAHVVGVDMVTEYEYDVAGRVTHLKMPGGTELFYSYDTVGRVSRIEVDHPSFSRQDLVNNITYKPFGPMRGLTLGSGESRTLTYDGAYRLSQLVSGAHIHKTFGYDANNNITSVTDGLGAPLRTYDYDEMNRLDYHSGADGVFEYEYDENGNRTRKNSTFDNYFYAANTNRLESAPEFNLNYNANGVTTQRGAIAFGVGSRNQLWQTADYSIPKYTNYFFNAFGERVYKYVHNGTFNQRFVYGDGAQLLHERGSQGTIDYVYLNGQPIAMIKDGSIFYLHTDHLGRPEVATNWAGLVAWSIEANAWSSDSASGGLTVNLRFPGQYYDAESGLHYNYFRFYDPVTGRYLSADPIGLAGGMNRFAYAGSNPVNAIDPFGLVTYSGSSNPLVLNLDDDSVPGGVRVVGACYADGSNRSYYRYDPTAVPNNGNFSPVDPAGFAGNTLAASELILTPAAALARSGADSYARAAREMNRRMLQAIVAGNGTAAWAFAQQSRAMGNAARSAYTDAQGARRYARTLGRVNVALGPILAAEQALSGESGWSKLGFYAVGIGATAVSGGNPAVGYTVAVGLFGGEISGLFNEWSKEIDSVVIDAID